MLSLAASAAPLLAKASPSRYLLFTTQRSGSTWVCDVLHRQNGIDCGVANPQHETSEHYPSHISEMMIEYSYMKHSLVNGFDYSTITWDKWRADCEAAFARLEREAADDAVGVGFKLMYDQVPPRLESAFVSWLAQANVTVVHLVREATALKVASSFQTTSGAMHSRNATAAAEQQKSTPLLSVPFATFKKKVDASIAIAQRWSSGLRYAVGVRYYYVSYESMLGPAAENYLRSVIAFVISSNVDVDLRRVSMESELHSLHKISCCHRLAPSLYDKMRSSFLPSSPLLQACSMLDTLANCDGHNTTIPK